MAYQVNLDIKMGQIAPPNSRKESAVNIICGGETERALLMSLSIQKMLTAIQALHMEVEYHAFSSQEPNTPTQHVKWVQ